MAPGLPTCVPPPRPGCKRRLLLCAPSAPRPVQPSDRPRSASPAAVQCDSVARAQCQPERCASVTCVPGIMFLGESWRGRPRHGRPTRTVFTLCGSRDSDTSLSFKLLCHVQCCSIHLHSVVPGVPQFGSLGSLLCCQYCPSHGARLPPSGLMWPVCPLGFSSCACVCVCVVCECVRGTLPGTARKLAPLAAPIVYRWSRLRRLLFSALDLPDRGAEYVTACQAAPQTHCGASL